jgi:predicted DNA-binding transcriptional regulator AlpA
MSVLVTCPHCRCALAVEVTGAETSPRLTRDGRQVVYAPEFMRLLQVGKSRFYEMSTNGLLPPLLPLPRQAWARTVVEDYLQGRRAS